MPLKPKSIGYFNLIIGKMFDGKTEELMTQARIIDKYTDKTEIFFVSKKDIRDIGDIIETHNGNTRKVIKIDKSSEIFNYLDDKIIYTIFIDEIQFFESDIYNTIITLKRLGHDIVAAGLDLDYQAKPFGQTLNLAGIADKIIRLENARCTYKEDGKICGNFAKYSQRINIKGLPVSDNGSVYKPGRDDYYTPRCEKHFKWSAQSEKELEKAKKIIINNKVKLNN